VEINSLYGLTREECMTSQSTEKRISGIWKYWNKYCLEKQRPLVYYPPYSLGVYWHKAEDFASDTNPLQKNIIVPQSMGFTTFYLDQMLCLEIPH
jgi:hypothetical protein